MLAAMRTTGEMRHVLFGDVLKFLFELLAFGRPAVAALHFFFETLLDFLDHVLQFHLARLHSSKVLQGMRERDGKAFVKSNVPRRIPPRLRSSE